MLCVMSDTTELEDLIARLTNDGSLLERGETATRQGAINPVLRALGWDTSNLEEVDPEFSDRSGGQVDYSLRGNGRDLVLLEAKRARERLDGHQDQLLGYAFRLGVQLAVLTNGLDWWLYLPMVPERTWEERRFRSVDFRASRAADVADELDRFLNRDKVIRGDALREAQHEFESQERDRRVRAVLQDAWQEVLADSDGLLRDLLAETVKARSGHQPDPGTISAFLSGIGGTEDAGAVPPPPAPQEARRQPRRRAKQPRESARTRNTPSSSSASSFTGRHPAAFWLDGVRHDVARWRAILQGVSELMVAEAGPDFAQRVADLRGRKRVYFSRQPEDLFAAVPLANSDLFVEGNLSANDCVRFSRRVLVAVRGNDDGFRIELAE